MLVFRPGVWLNCVFQMFAGTGHAIWGYRNANNTNIERCQSSKNWGHGFYLSSGPDSNNCAWYRCSAVGNKGWGFFDSGFLGSHPYACHTDINHLGPYFVDPQDQASSTVVGCYSEENQPPSKIGHLSVVMGGKHGAGFTDDTNGLLLLNKRHVSPLQITDRVKPDSCPVGQNIQYDIEIGEGLVENSSSDRINLLKFSSLFEALKHGLRFIRRNPGRDPEARPFLRLVFGTGTSRINTTSMEWAQGDIRGPGGIAFPQGFLLRHEAIALQSERKLDGWSGPNPKPGTYEPGDAIVDLSGRNFFYFPRTRFGHNAPAWQANNPYQIGDMIRPVGSEENADVYVVKAFYDGSITYASREYDMQFLPGLTAESEIPATGRGRLIVAQVGDRLHFKLWGFASDRAISEFTEAEADVPSELAKNFRQFKAWVERLPAGEIPYANRRRMTSSLDTFFGVTLYQFDLSLHRISPCRARLSVD